MSIHYKFRSSLDYDTLKIDGQSISLVDLREAIMAQKKISKTSAYTLEITDAQTKKVYTEDRTLIPKNSSVIVKRVPAAAHGGAASYMPLTDKDESSAKKKLTVEKLTKVGDLANANATEEDKIAAMMNQSGEEYAISTYMRRPAPPGSYTCFKCGQAGHFIRNCPTVVGNDAKFASRPQWRSFAGIPKDHMSQLMKEEEKKRAAILEQAGQAMGAYRPVVASDVIDHELVPPELQCPICKRLFTDAVLIPCCGTSYCDECIRNLLIDKEFICPNCQSHTSPDQLVANVHLRKAAEKHRNQLEGVNKGVTTIRNVNEDSTQKGTPERKEATVEVEAPPIKTEVDSVVKTEPTADLSTSTKDLAEVKMEVNMTAPEDKAMEETKANVNTTSSPQHQEPSKIEETTKITSGVALGSVSSAFPTFSLPKVSSQTFLTASLPYSTTPLVSGSLVSNSAYSNYLNASVLKPRLPLGVPAVPVIAPGMPHTLPILPRPASYPSLNLLPSHLKGDRILSRGVGLNLPGIGPMVGRPSTMDPMMVLDNQQPLSEEEFYRTQKKLKSFGKRRADHDDRYQSRRFERSKRKNESARPNRNYSDFRNRERSRERTRPTDFKVGSAKVRHGSKGISNSRHSKRSRSPERRPKQKSQKRPMRSRSRSRSWSGSKSRSRSRSFSGSGSKSISRSRSNSFSRSSSGSLSRSRSRSSSHRRSRSISLERSPSLDNSLQLEEQFSDRPRRSGNCSGRSSERKWSTSPEVRSAHESTPDDAISLSPASHLGFSDGDQDKSAAEEESGSLQKTDNNRKTNGKSKVLSAEQKNAKLKESQPDDRQSRRDRLEDTKKTVVKTNPPTGSGKNHSREKEEDRSNKSVREKKSEAKDSKISSETKGRRLKSSASKVITTSVVTQKGKEKSKSDREDKKGKTTEKGSDSASKVSNSSRKEVKKSTMSVKDRLDKGEKKVDRKVTPLLAMEEEENKEKDLGLQISKDRDGTVREVFTSRARKRGKEDVEKVKTSYTGKEKTRGADSSDSKVRIVCVVEPEPKKKKKETETDLRRVVLSTTSAEEPETESSSARKSKHSVKKKAKSKKHKKHKHKKTKKKKHKSKKSKGAFADEDSDAEVGVASSEKQSSDGEKSDID